MPHQWINNGEISKFEQLSCSICGLLAFRDSLYDDRIYLYSYRNNITNFTGLLLTESYINCDEFIIKNIIE